LLVSGCASFGTLESDKTQLEIANGQLESSAHSTIAVEFLHQDIDQLVAHITKVHPEPFSLVSLEALLANAELVKQSIQYPMTRREFYLKVAPLIALLSDVHTTLGLPDEFQPVLQGELTEKKLFPLAVLYEEGGLYVAADLSDTPQVATGARILSINQLPVDYLLKTMTRITPFETETGLRRKVQVDFAWLLAKMGLATKHYVVGFEVGSEKQSIQLVGLTPVSTKAKRADNTSQSDSFADSMNGTKQKPSYYGSSRLNGDSGLLWFNDFYEDPETFNHYLRNQLEQFSQQGIKNLVIDVRYNDGGLSQNIKSLLSALTVKRLSWYQAGQIKVSSALKEWHRQVTRSRRKNKFRWGLQWLPLEWTDSLQYQIMWSDVGETIDVGFEPIESAGFSRFDQVVVLTNGYCYSACSAFVAAVNLHQLAQTVGETAGSVAQVQYAYPIEFLLKHSRLELSLPTIKLTLNPKVTKRTPAIMSRQWLIRPTVEIKRTRSDIMNRHDASLKAALSYIQSISKKE
jgi:hypothetical protein